MCTQLGCVESTSSQGPMAAYLFPLTMGGPGYLGCPPPFTPSHSMVEIYWQVANYLPAGAGYFSPATTASPGCPVVPVCISTLMSGILWSETATFLRQPAHHPPSRDPMEYSIPPTTA